MDLKVDRVAVCLRERESLFQEEGPKAEKDREMRDDHCVLHLTALLQTDHNFVICYDASFIPIPN